MEALMKNEWNPMLKIQRKQSILYAHQDPMLLPDKRRQD
jgi:hypothetical protein